MTIIQTDIEALIDRSFLIRETNFRRLHRQLQWHQSSRSDTVFEGSYASSTTSRTTVTRSMHRGSDGSGCANSICEDQASQFDDGDNESIQQSLWEDFGEDQDLPSYETGRAETIVTESPTSPTRSFKGNGPLRLRTGLAKQHAD